MARVGERVLVAAREGADLAAVGDRAERDRRHDEEHDDGEPGRGDEEENEAAECRDDVAERHRDLRGEERLERRAVGAEPRDELARARGVEEADLLRQEARVEALADAADPALARQGEEEGAPGDGGALEHGERGEEERDARDLRRFAAGDRAVHDGADALRVDERQPRARDEQDRSGGERRELLAKEAEDLAGGGGAGHSGDLGSSPASRHHFCPDGAVTNAR